MRCLRSVLLVIALTVGLPATGSALSFWFDSDPTEDWTDPNNWMDDLGNPGVPGVTDIAYVTTSGTHPNFLGFAEILSTPEAVSSLYIGGWQAQYDGAHGGNPTQTGVPIFGELVVESGASISVEPQRYIRVGTRGATGTLIQSGGTVTSTTGPTLGWGSDASVGIHEMSAGALVGPGVAVGVQGLGQFTMSGGDFTETCAGCSSVVGRGYLQSEQTSEGEIPGIGFMKQSGGSFTGSNLKLGQEAGSVGVLHVLGTAVMTIGTRFYVGENGTGSVVQTGGTVSSGWCLELGAKAGSIGSYTIEGGAFNQTGTAGTTTRCDSATRPEGFYNGAGGVGTLTVVGNDATISFGRYRQSADSTLAFMIDENTTENAVSEIQVVLTAEFEPGAKIRIARPGTVGGPAIVNPSSVDLLTAGQGITGISSAYELAVVGPDASEWILSITDGPGSEQTLVASLPDLGDDDGDLVLNYQDNCLLVPNGPNELANQLDADQDGYGNACDGDFNQDSSVGGNDYVTISGCFNAAVPTTGGPIEDPTCAESDLDGDGVVAGTDIGIFFSLFGGAPGPSGLSCAGFATPCP